MTILDTNIVSELLKPSPEPAVLDWFDSIRVPVVAFTAVTVMEIRHGIARLPRGRRRDNLTAKFEQFSALAVSEIIPLDLPAADEAGAYLAERERIGRPLADHRVAVIAGIVLRLSNRDGRPTTLATRNVNDFAGLNVINPWTA